MGTKKRLCVIGHFGFGRDCSNGQTIKTKIVTNELERVYGAAEITRMDTYGGKKQLLAYPYRMGKALRKHDNVIILPAHKGLRVIAPLLALENRCFHRKLHYVVIGGWLPDYLKRHSQVAKALRRFHGIYVETATMKKALDAMGYGNVYVMPNCKPLKILSESELVYQTAEPFRLCTFSRVMKEKGIQDAVEAVEEINREQGRTVYTLDIYGQIDEQQKMWFSELQKRFPDSVRYRGIVPYDKSVDVLKDYFALLFPTRFYTEGIPGTIIDAYAAGLPVIAAKWESFSDIIDEKTGIGYEFGETSELISVLLRLAKEPQEIHALKENCIHKASCYLPVNTIKVLLQQLTETHKI